MCGISGYVGYRKTEEVLIKALEKLEYRGYDSAGVALASEDDIQIIKAVGKVEELKNKINNTNLIDSTYGIAHTRWATNGKVSEENCHPHTQGIVTLVHNGIIENLDELKKHLGDYKFNSETDTEVIAAYLDYLIKKYDIKDAFSEFIKDVEGSYALAIIIKGHEGIYALRKGSPLVVGIGKNENFISSDLNTILDYTNRYMLIEEDEVVYIKKDVVKVTSSGVFTQKETLTSNLKSTDSELGKYDHFMLKEIMEEPGVCERLISYYLDNKDDLDISKYKHIHVIACGSACYAGLIFKSILNEYAGLDIRCEIASEYRYEKQNYEKDTLVIAISQSGETADTIAAINLAKENGIDTLGIVNVEGSTVSRLCDKTLYIMAGPEIAVATTKAYVAQVLLLSLIASVTSIKLGKLDETVLDEYKIVPEMLTKVLDNRKAYKKMAKEIYKAEDIFFLGRNIDYAISMEGSLKLKEVSYIHSEAYPAGELKHGTISLVSKDMPVISIITREDLKAKSLLNLEECESRGAKGFIITRDGIKTGREREIAVPDTNQLLIAVYIVPVLQLLAYEVALNRGCNVDKPRNLAKSVTVE